MKKDPNKHSAKKLAAMKADELFPSLLSAEQHDSVRSAKKKKKKGSNVQSSMANSYFVAGSSDEVAPEFTGTEADFDIVKHMRNAEDPVTGTLRDLKIDDGDMKRAKNYYDFAFNILGKDVHPPWSRQLWIGMMLFGEVCPCCSNKKWLDVNNVPKDYIAKEMPEHLQFLEYGVCPKCKRNKWDLIQNHGLKNYLQLDNVLGQRSGKSSSAGGGYAPYIAHRYLTFPNLATMSKSMQASTELTMTFVSLNFAKAVGVLWTPFRKTIENSSWFKDYFSMLDFYKNKYGKELYRNSTLYMSFFHKNLRFYPSGPRSSTLRGDTRIAALLDELGLFPLPTGNEEEDENSERANADEAHKSLMNSLTTVSATTLKLMKKGQSFAPPAVMMCVSSPISQRDKVMRLLRESKTEEGNKTILGINMPTWEMNPDLDRDSPVIASAYASNWEKAERDFGANPPAVHSTYIKKATYEKDLFVGGQNTHNLKYMLDQPGEIYGTLERIRTVKWPSLITIDAGHVNNSFAIIGGHFDFDNQKTVVSTVLEVMAHDGRRINFSLVYKHIILPLARDLNAIALLADQWQSVELLYRIKEDMGNNPLGKPRTLGKQHSPRRKDFDSVVTMANNRNLILPSLNEQVKQRIFDGQIDDWRSELIGRPIEHLLLQMATVKSVGEERCPEKGDGYTDDEFRALVLFASKLHEPKVFERLVEAKDFNYSNGRGKQPMPVFIGRSGGGIMLPNSLRQGLTQHLGLSNNMEQLLKNNGG
jgi:hypothetical protein